MRILEQKSLQIGKQGPKIDINSQLAVNNRQKEKHFDRDCSQLKVIQNNDGKSGILIQNILKNGENYRNFKFLRVILFGITIVQFSLQGGVILIQYISSKITLNLFVVLIIIDCLLIILILVLFKNINGIAIAEKNKQRNQNQIKEAQIQIQSIQHNAPTLPKIKNQQLPRQYEKTKKLKPIQIELKGNTQTKKCLKNIQSLVLKNHRKKTLIIMENNNTEFTYVLLVAKIFQNVFALICTTVSFLTIQNPIIQGVSYMSVLLVTIDILVILSFIVLALFYFKFKNFKKTQENMQMEGRLKIIQQKVESPKINTIPSIQNHLQLKKGEKKKTTISIEQMMKTNNQCSENLNPNHNVVRIMPQSKKQIMLSKPAVEVEVDQLSLRKIMKKSVLKNTKSCFGKNDFYEKSQGKDFQNMQRRKVEINSKKIEYFEYSDISSGKSELMEDGFKTKDFNERPKYKGHNSRFLKHKIILDSKLLQRKRQEKTKRQLTKSNKQVRTKKQKDLDLSFRSHFEDFLS